jgi:hypothetical protein
LISEDRAEKAVEWVRDNAKRIGRAKGHQVYCEANLRRVKALEMIGKEGGVGEREALAYASEPYRQAIEDYQNATADYETLRIRKDAADMTFECWRSQNSTRRSGL